MGKKVSKKAKKQGAYASGDYNGNGYFPLRSAWPSFLRICYGFLIGSRVCDYSDHYDGGLCAALQIIYDPDSPLSKSESVTRTALVYDCGGPELTSGGKDKKMTSTADVVTFGKKKYIWLNREACESGKDKTMKLWSLELEECAMPFDKNGNTNDFGNDATEPLRHQVRRVVTEGCTAEELAMIVKVRMSDKDGYATATPVFTKAQEKMLEEIEKRKQKGKVEIEECTIDDYVQKDIEHRNNHSNRLEQENTQLKKQIEEMEKTISAQEKVIAEICNALGVKVPKIKSTDGRNGK